MKYSGRQEIREGATRHMGSTGFFLQRDAWVRGSDNGQLFERTVLRF
jgi:hypothetical protein